MEIIDEAPRDVENHKDPLQEELDKLSPLSSSRCIYRVTERLRHVNEKSYTPQAVSIGPLHHGKEHLKAMEEHKKRYLRHFLIRNGVSFNDYIKKIREQEGRLRGCYAEPIEFSSDEFVRIVSVDAAFVIDLLVRCYYSGYGADDDDYIFRNPGKISDVLPDLMLLENQLPFFILQDVLTLFSSFRPPSLLDLAYFFFLGKVYGDRGERLDNIRFSGVEVQHFVDLIRYLYLPLKPTETKGAPKGAPKGPPSATELHRAGVEFEVGKGSSLFDIEFSGGILKIPSLRVTEWTDLTLRNILAFEKCHHRTEDYVANYVVLMKSLAKTSRDVELLVEKGIIINWRLGDTQKISTLLLDLGTEIMISRNHHAILCEDLKTYSTTPWRKWMANLKQNYFNTPWSTLSVAAAVILLVLTVVQTACSIKSVP